MRVKTQHWNHSSYFFSLLFNYVLLWQILLVGKFSNLLLLVLQSWSWNKLCVDDWLTVNIFLKKKNLSRREFTIVWFANWQIFIRRYSFNEETGTYVEVQEAASNESWGTCDHCSAVASRVCTEHSLDLGI